MAWTLATMETAILERLQNDATITAYCQTIQAYEGQLEDDLARTALLFPAIFVAFDRGEYTPATNEEYRATVNYAVLVAVQSMLGTDAIRQGHDSAIGIYQILRDVKIALHTSALGSGDDAMFAYLVQEFAFARNRTCKVYQADYQVRDVLISYGE